MKKTALIILFALATFTLCGCYDSKDIDEMVYVVAIGVDEAEDENTKFTLQLALPLNISGGVETSFDTEQGSAPLNNISISESDIYTAIDKINMNISKEINISHCKLIVFSKAAAEGGLERYKSILTDDKNLRPNTYIAVCDGDASEYLSAVSSPHELNPARYYDLMFEKGHSAYSSAVYLKNLYSPSQLTAPLVSSSDDNTKKSGTALFKDLKMTATLSPDETLYFKMLNGSFTNANIRFPDGQMLSVHQSKAPKVKLNIKNKSAYITLNLYGQKSSGGNKSANILSDNAKKYIANSCGNIIKISLAENTDILGLENYAHKFFLTQQALDDYDFSSQYKNYNIEVSVK